jgi:hypothetical protein
MHKSKKEDTGLRGTFAGRLYVDKKVFYKRKDIQDIINNMKNSKSIKKQISESKANAL